LFVGTMNIRLKHLDESNTISSKFTQILILRSNNNNSQTLLTKLTFKGATIDVDDEDELADEDTHAQV
jgi:hypothetical protein